MASSGMHVYCKNRRSEEHVTASIVASSPILVTLMKEALGSPETSVLTRATWRNIQEDAILHSHRRENPQSYMTNIFIIQQNFCLLRGAIFFLVSHSHVPVSFLCIQIFTVYDTQFILSLIARSHK
jgi:hypothetical protein